MKNKEYSDLLGIPLARWRWAIKNVLPPDPAAPMQGGKARDISEWEGFIVFLSVHLIHESGLKLNDTKTVLRDLKSWMKGKDFRDNDFVIHIMKDRTGKGRFCYQVIEHIRESMNSDGSLTLRYRKEPLYLRKKTVPDESSVKLLNVSILWRIFQLRLKGKI